MRVPKALGGLLALALVAGMLASGSAVAATNFPKKTFNLTFRGSINLTALANQSSANEGGDQGAGAGEIPSFGEPVEKDESPAPSAASLPTPTPPNTPVASGQLPGFRGWDGLNHTDQRLANNGNQFSLEPPDQGLCASGSAVFEQVNVAVQLYSTSGAPLLSQPVSENQFFLYPPNITRPSPLAGGGPPFGPFLSDPKCYYDVATGRWFHTILEIDVDHATGGLKPKSHTEIAVSTTSDPAGTWRIYEFDSTDAFPDGSHPNCPCLGDQPLIGADAYGFYVSTAEYSLFSEGFNGPQVYAISKSALVAGATGIKGVQFSHLNVGTNAGCFFSGTLQPATSPQGVFNTNNGGTEFLLSSHDTIPCDPVGTENPDVLRGLTVWGLTNTSALSSNPLALNLTASLIDSQPYGLPVAQLQEDGPHPLGASLGHPTPSPTANDDRMNQVVYANGKLWGAVNTRVAGSPTRDGIAWFIVRPSISSGQVTGAMSAQGYLAAANVFLSFPSIGVNSAGRGAMTFTLMGLNDFPSSAYAPITNTGTGPIHIAGVGQLPDDGFSCYPEFGSPSCRWGDYSAAVASPDGSRIWMASEYIPDRPRTSLANWGTFVSSVTTP